MKHPFRLIFSSDHIAVNIFFCFTSSTLMPSTFNMLVFPFLGKFCMPLSSHGVHCLFSRLPRGSHFHMCAWLEGVLIWIRTLVCSRFYSRKGNFCLLIENTIYQFLFILFNWKLYLAYCFFEFLMIMLFYLAKATHRL